MSNLICHSVAGSRLYGLEGPTSDNDFIGVFVHKEFPKILGLERHDHEAKRTQTEDSNLFELRHFLTLLRKGNTQLIELLFNDTFLSFKPEWTQITENKWELIDSERLFSCLRGYAKGELDLANGKRTGLLGSKRKDALEKFGFSNRNFVHYFRLMFAGEIFFSRNIFPVRVREFAIGDFLFDLKWKPENFKLDQLNEMSAEAENRMVKAFEARVDNYEFNDKLANKICLRIYGPIIKEQLAICESSYLFLGISLSEGDPSF